MWLNPGLSSSVMLSHHYCGGLVGALLLGVGSVPDIAGARHGRSRGCLGRKQCLPGGRGQVQRAQHCVPGLLPYLLLAATSGGSRDRRTCSYCSEPCLSKSAERESPRPASGRRSNSELGPGRTWDSPSRKSMLRSALIPGWLELWCPTLGPRMLWCLWGAFF